MAVHGVGRHERADTLYQVKFFGDFSMGQVTFADVVHTSVSFSQDDPAGALVLRLIDTPWFQRLRDISQTANTRLVYMFSEHSRFGHSVGVSFLATVLMDRLAETHREEVASYRKAVAAAALLHDIGHLAPGSHTAYKTWFPESPDLHEALSCRVVLNDPGIRGTLEDEESGLSEKVAMILAEDPSLPHWTWQIISGGGWNVDRGNWCIADSILAGVSYGRYNIDAILDSFTILPSTDLAFRENRLDAMMHFALSRHAMYRQVYQHRVLLSADRLNFGVAARARDLGPDYCFADDVMQAVLRVGNPQELTLEQLFAMREFWWRYHLAQWQHSQDKILSDLAGRILERRLLKTVRVLPDDDAHALRTQVDALSSTLGYDPRYYVGEVSHAYMHRGDGKQSLLVHCEDGDTLRMQEADPLFSALIKETEESSRTWLVMPREVKEALGRSR